MVRNMSKQIPYLLGGGFKKETPVYQPVKRKEPIIPALLRKEPIAQTKTSK